MIRFIHIPKTAGQTISTWLENNEVEFILGEGKIHVKGRYKYKHVHKQSRFYTNENFPKFAIVRNPYDRFVSYYTYILKQTNNKWDISFEEFVQDKSIEVPTKIPSPWILQKDWVVDENDNMLVENIFYFENLENEIQKFFKLDVSLPKINVSRSNTNYKEYYKNDLKNIIFDRFEEDFKFFNYDREL